MKRTVRSDCFENLPDWLSPYQARVFLRVSRTSLYAMVHNGSLPYRRFGRLIRIPKSAVRPESSQPPRPAA
jgi:excisionase family DNA binding protein